MNTLQMIRQAQLKRQRLFEAQKMMAKAYRGVPYTDLNHDRPHKEKPSELSYRGVRYSI